MPSSFVHRGLGVGCRDTLWLVDLIIDNSNPQEPHWVHFPGDDQTPLQGAGGERHKGLPIGNLTSQFWANVYMSRFDHFVKQETGAKGYIRYVDDFVVFSNDKAQLQAWKTALTDYLATLRLLPHPNKTHIHQTARGVPFLGFRVFPCYRILRKEKAWRFRRHLRSMMEARRKRRLPPQTLEDRLNAWLGHIRFGQTARMEKNVFSYLRRMGVSLYRSPSGSWRVLEQKP